MDADKTELLREKLEMNEHYERLLAMWQDDHGTWDLSPKDKAAIRWALDGNCALSAQPAEPKQQDYCGMCGCATGPFHYPGCPLLPNGVLAAPPAAEPKKQQEATLDDRTCGSVGGPAGPRE